VPARLAQSCNSLICAICATLVCGKQAIRTIFLVEPTTVGWYVRIGDERLGSFSTQRQALDDVKNRRAEHTEWSWKGAPSLYPTTKSTGLV